MTAGAQFVYRFDELKTVISGMRTMAGNTTHTENDPVDMRRSVFLFLAHQILLVGVTGNTEVQRTVSPELETVVAPMGVMAQGTTSDHGPMAVFKGKPLFFVCMTGKAEFRNIAFGETDFPRVS